MKRIFVLGALVLVALGSAFAQAQEQWYIGKPIKDIRFQGLVVVESKEMDPIVREYKGKIFTEELYISLLSRMYGLDYFSEIQPEAVPVDASASAVIILFKLVENPSVAAVIIEGNQGLRTNEILDVLTVKTSTIFNGSRLRLDEIAIRQLYQRKGYPDAAVSSRSVKRADGNMDVIYTVSEGTQNYVSTIQFEGIAAFSAFSLKGELEVKEKGLFQSGQFSEAKLEESRQKLELYYKKRGYIDATVTDVRRDATVDEKGSRALSLTFVINEGKRYLYDGLTFSGNALYSTQQLTALVRQKPGAFVNYEKLVADQTRVADLYFDNGYIYNAFDLAEARDEERGSIAYRVMITEREQALVEAVVIRGAVKTLERVIRREMPIKDGDVFSKAKIMEGLRNLYGLQYFSSITPSYEPGSQEPYIRLVITVEEQSTAEIQFGISYAPSEDPDAFPLVGLVKWNEKNFLGQGQNLSLGLNVSPDTQDMTLGFQENWLMDKRWSAGASFSFAHAALSAAQDSNMDGVPDPYSSWDEYVASGKSIPSGNLMDYDTWSFSLGLSTGYTFKPGPFDLSVSGGYLIKLTDKTYDPSVYNPLDSTISSNLNAWLLSNTLYARVYMNGLDLWYDPSEGYFLSQRLAMTGFLPSELSRYFRSDSKAEGYLTLFDWPVFASWSFKGVLAAHSGFTALLPWFGQDAPIASDAEKLRVDGTFVGRGWGAQLSGQYGTSLWESWAELRFPVVPGILSLDGFFDAAALMTESGLLDIRGIMESGKAAYAGSTWSDLGASNFAFSAGLGIRFTIPQFPFKLYFAKRFYAGADGLKVANKPGAWDFVLSITTMLN